MDWQGKSYDFLLDYLAYSVNLKQRWTDYKKWTDFKGKWVKSESYSTTNEIFEFIIDPCYKFLWWKLEQEGKIDFSSPSQPFPPPQPQPQPPQFREWQCDKVKYVGYTKLDDQVTMTGPFGPSIGTGMQFSPDGTILYVQDYAWYYPDGYIYRFDLLTPWDVATAQYKNKYPIRKVLDDLLKNSSARPASMVISPDGLNLYVSYYVGIAQFRLLKAWDITTIDISSFKKVDISGIEDFTIDPTGTVLFGSVWPYYIYKYRLSTPWDITTISNTPDDKYIEVPHSGYVDSFYVTPEGTILYVSAGGYVYYYTLSIPWDFKYSNFKGFCFYIYDILYKSGESLRSFITNLRFSNNGVFCYVTERSNTKVFKFISSGG